MGDYGVIGLERVNSLLYLHAVLFNVLCTSCNLCNHCIVIIDVSQVLGQNGVGCTNAFVLYSSQKGSGGEDGNEGYSYCSSLVPRPTQKGTFLCWSGNETTTAPDPQCFRLVLSFEKARMSSRGCRLDSDR